MEAKKSFSHSSWVWDAWSQQTDYRFINRGPQDVLRCHAPSFLDFSGANAEYRKAAMQTVLPLPERFVWGRSLAHSEATPTLTTTNFAGMPGSVDSGFGGDWQFQEACDGHASFYAEAFGPSGEMFEKLAELFSMSETQACQIISGQTQGNNLLDALTGNENAEAKGPHTLAAVINRCATGEVNVWLNDPSVGVEVYAERIRSNFWHERQKAGAAILEKGFSALAQHYGLQGEYAQQRYSLVFDKIAQIKADAKAWLTDDGWKETGERVASIMDDGLCADQDKKSWVSWQEVGQQINGRIMGSPSEKEPGVLSYLKFSAICWEKAQAEATPTQCVESFIDHVGGSLLDSAIEAAAVIVGGGDIDKPRKIALIVKAFLVSLRDTFRDKDRCDVYEMQDKVESCMRDLYEDVFDLPGRDF